MQYFHKIVTFLKRNAYNMNGDTMEEKIIMGLVLFILLFAILKLPSRTSK